jgi:hypothetical protein
MNIFYQRLIAYLCVLVLVPAIILTGSVVFLPITDSGCNNYQYVRGMFTSEGVAIGCEWNGTAWHFNETLVNLSFHEVREYKI